jgi:hypothetical protein
MDDQEKDRIYIGGAVYTVDADGVVEEETGGDEWEWTPPEQIPDVSPYVQWLLMVSVDWVRASESGEAKC